MRSASGSRTRRPQTPVTFSSAYIGELGSGAALVPGSNRRLTFGGSHTLTLAAGESAWSDPVRFDVDAFHRLAVSLDVASSVEISGHQLGLTTNYIGTYGSCGQRLGRGVQPRSRQRRQLPVLLRRRDRRPVPERLRDRGPARGLDHRRPVQHPRSGHRGDPGRHLQPLGRHPGLPAGRPVRPASPRGVDRGHRRQPGGAARRQRTGGGPPSGQRRPAAGRAQRGHLLRGNQRHHRRGDHRAAHRRSPGGDRPGACPRRADLPRDGDCPRQARADDRMDRRASSR